MYRSQRFPNKISSRRGGSRHGVLLALVTGLIVVALPGAAMAQGLDLGGSGSQEKSLPPLATLGGGSGVSFTPGAAAVRWVLTVYGPGNFTWSREGQGGPPAFSPAMAGGELEDGTYTFMLTAARQDGGPTALSGTFVLEGGTINGARLRAPQPFDDDARAPGSTPPFSPEESSEPCKVGDNQCKDRPGTDAGPTPTTADHDGGGDELELVHAESVTITGDLCVGTDCPNPAVGLGTDDIRLQENNIQIQFLDTSAAPFPSNDWRIIVNDSASGGANYISIEDSTAGRDIVRFEAGARADALVLDSLGDLGLGTRNPILDLHMLTGNTPGVRFEQDNSSGFTPQTWDVAGHEQYFFVRDATNGAQLPFRIYTGAPTDSLAIRATGNVGMGTSSPIKPLHVRRTDGTAEILVEDTDPTSTTRNMLQFINNGGSQAKFVDTDTGDSWKMKVKSNEFSFDHVPFGKANTGRELQVLKSGRFIVGPGGVANFDVKANGNASLAGTLTENSTREAKENLRLIDADRVVERLMTLPLYEWNYIDDADDKRHFGPTAEDFWQAYGLAGTDREIATRDMATVALVAVQEVIRAMRAQQGQLLGYRAQIRELGGEPDAVLADPGAWDGIPGGAGLMRGNGPIAGAGIIGAGGGDGPETDDVPSTAEAPADYEPTRARVSGDDDSVLLGSLRRAMAATGGTMPDERSVVRVYKNYDAWWGENRDAATLSEMGKSRGYDWFVHEISESWTGVPEDTEVAIFTSASNGDRFEQIQQQSSPVAQASLQAFVQGGGTLLLSLADNEEFSGYRAPGADGMPELIMPSDCGGATLSNVMYGKDRLAGTSDDHPLMIGPDGLPATEDDLTPFDVGLRGGCYAAHGNLEEGIRLPDDAVVLMTANFGGLQKPVLAEYELGDGHVIVTTLTMEYFEHSAAGTGASKLLTNLYGYAFGVDEIADRERPDDDIRRRRPGGGQ